MSDQTTERAFESYLEETLINKSGWKHGSNKDWDKQLVLSRSEVIAFIKETQPVLWHEMEALYGEILPNIVKSLWFSKNTVRTSDICWFKFRKPDLFDYK